MNFEQSSPRAPEAGKEGAPLPVWKRFWPEILVALITFCVFIPSLHYPMLSMWDDTTYLAPENMVFTWDNVTRYFEIGFMNLYTPLTMISLMLDHLIFGNTPACYRITNILLQCVNGVLICAILRHLSIRTWIVLLVTLLWSIHPQRIESVVWIVERKDVLCTAFSMAALLVFLKEFDARRWPIASCVLMILAFLTKPSPVGLFSMMLIYAFWKKGWNVDWKKLALPVLTTIFMVSFISMMMARSVPADKIPKLEAPLVFLSIVFHNALFYISNSLLPFELNPIYPYVNYSDYWIIPVFFTFAFATLWLWKRTVQPWKPYLMMVLAFGFSWIAFFSTASGGFAFNPTDYADRYSCLQSLPLWGFVAFFTNRICKDQPRFNRSFQILFGAMLTLCMYQTFSYMPLWGNQKELLSYSIFQSRDLTLANKKTLIVLGELAHRDRDTKTLDFVCGVLSTQLDDDRVRANRPLYEPTKNTLNVLEFYSAYYQGDLKTAWKKYMAFKEAAFDRDVSLFKEVASDPQMNDRMLAFLLTVGEKQEAIFFLCHVVVPMNQRVTASHHYYAGLLEILADHEERAIQAWEKALELEPGHEQAANNLKRIHERRAARKKAQQEPSQKTN